MASRLYVLVVAASIAVVLADSDGINSVTPPAPAVATASAPRAQASAPVRPASPVDVEPEQLLRIYDFSPVSETNPVVAWVADTPIAIPRSEFQAYLKAEVSEDEQKALDATGRKKHLERLIDEMVLLRDAYGRKIDASERIARALEVARKMLLVEFLTREEVGDRAKSAEHYATLQAALEDRLFEKAQVDVSNEGYAAVKEAVAQHGAGASRDLPAETAARPLARCGDMKIAVGDAFAMYVGLPSSKRPDITTPKGISGLLKSLLADGLKMAEARARGLDKSVPYREKVAANRAALTRMWLQDRITDKASQRMKAPETEAHLRQWYDENRKTRYTYQDEKGIEKTMSFDAQKPAIRNDYFDVLRERVRAERVGSLREGLKIEIDERLL